MGIIAIFCVRANGFFFLERLNKSFYKKIFLLLIYVINMLKIVIFVYCVAISYARKNYPNNRDDIDNEDNEKNYSGNKYNITHHPTTTLRTMKGEVVVEKFVDTLMANEKYLKLIEVVEYKIDHLDMTFQERSNIIIKYLSEILRVVKSAPEIALETALRGLQKDLDNLKEGLIHRSSGPIKLRAAAVSGTECHMDAVLDNRLSLLESHIKAIMGSVDTITGIISEVKTRQQGRSSRPPSTEYAGSSIDAVALISEFRKAIHEQKSRKCDCKSGRVDRSERYPTDCREIQLQGFNVSGIYKIKPDDVEAFYVLCDLSSSGGGWTVIQNRFDGSQDFYKSWIEYKHGFGNLAGEFWLGLEKIYYLTNQKLYELRIEIEASHGQEASAGYSVFTIGPEFESYRISTLGTYRGNAGDSLSYHAGQKFSTFDSDNDEWKEGSCSVEHGGAWWYKKCDKRYSIAQTYGKPTDPNHNSNLNGRYPAAADESTDQSIYWISFKGPNYPLYKTRMMIRPLPATRALEFNDQTRIGNVLDGTKAEKHKTRPKDVKGTYDLGRNRPSYRYDDNVHSEGFFSNYA